MVHSFNSPVANRFVQSLILDQFPTDAAILCDFGFSNAKDPRMLFAAYQHSLKTGQSTPKDFDEAVGYGPALTVLIAATDPNMTVETDYDHM